MNLHQRVVAVATASLLLILMGAGLAQAVGWAFVSVSWDGLTRATGSGDTYKSGATVRNDFRLNDTSDDSNNVYGRSEFFFLSNGRYSSAGTLLTGEYSYSNTPRIIPLFKSLRETSIGARTSSNVCVQLGWPVPDRCSNTALATFSY